MSDDRVGAKSSNISSADQDEWAFRKLVEKYTGLVAIRQTGDSQRAEEISQDVFLAVAKSKMVAGICLASWASLQEVGDLL